MTDTATCPDSEILRRTAAGDFSDSQLTATVDHLTACTTCRYRFESFLNHDAQALRGQAAPNRPESSANLGDHAASSFQYAAPPAKIGSDFLVLESIGAGGMGALYKCHDTRLGRVVAVKLVRSDRNNPDDLQRSAREARAQAALNHPNIVPVYEIGQHAGLPMIVMEYMPGGTLKNRIARGPLPPRHAAYLVAAIARGLQHAHNAGVIHRDLKPSNILLSDAGPNPKPDQENLVKPKIADFGLARLLSEASDLTASDAVPGTPAYLAPELFGTCKTQATPASDLYALGVILYESLTGRPPFTGVSFVQLGTLIETATPVSPRELTAGISRDLETICLKCLQKNPAHRYASSQALAEDLEAFLAGRPIMARPVHPLIQSWRWCLRNRRLAAAIGVAALSLVCLAIGGVAVAFSQAKLRRLADNNGKLAVAQANKAAESEREARIQRDQARGQFYDSSRVLHDIGSLLVVYKHSDMPEVDIRKINLEFQKRVLRFSDLYLKRPDLGTDSPEYLSMSLYNAARAYDELGDVAEAVRTYERLLDLARKTTPLATATETFRHLTTASTLNLAEIHKRHGRYDQAIALLEPFWLAPVDPVTKQPPDPDAPEWRRLRELFGAKLRELYELKNLPAKARHIDEEVERLKTASGYRPTP